MIFLVRPLFYFFDFISFMICSSSFFLWFILNISMDSDNADLLVALETLIFSKGGVSDIFLSSSSKIYSAFLNKISKDSHSIYWIEIELQCERASNHAVFRSLDLFSTWPSSKDNWVTNFSTMCLIRMGISCLFLRKFKGFVVVSSTIPSKV